MDKSEPIVDPTLITCVIMVYKPKASTIGTHKSIGFFKIQF